VTSIPKTHIGPYHSVGFHICARQTRCRLTMDPRTPANARVPIRSWLSRRPPSPIPSTSRFRNSETSEIRTMFRIELPISPESHLPVHLIGWMIGQLATERRLEADWATWGRGLDLSQPVPHDRMHTLTGWRSLTSPEPGVAVVPAAYPRSVRDRWKTDDRREAHKDGG
jgi:hypothetical protein